MATTRRELSRKINSTGKSEIILRLTVGRGIQPRIHTALFIRPDRFRNGAIIKPRRDRQEAAELQQLEARLTAIEQYLLAEVTRAPHDRITRHYLITRLNAFCRAEVTNPQPAGQTLASLFSTFISCSTFSAWRVKRYRVLQRALCRYEAYRSLRDCAPYTIDITTFTADDITDFVTFLRDEHSIAPHFPSIYTAADRTPLPRGNNTIACALNALRAFFNWCSAMGHTANRPFDRYRGNTAEIYGTPYYITPTERDIIADADLTHEPRLAAQRDIFIFQCLIGCRVSDLMRLTPANVIDGAIEYIPSKTRATHPEIIRVPLHPRAEAIIARHSSHCSTTLLPFISQQRYNMAIRRIFTLCGITRPVTLLNPITGLEEQRPINEVAASHIARRTFIGNLYKKVKDPCLVGKLSGHKDGSKAFARYRDIDDDMRRDLIALL